MATSGKKQSVALKHINANTYCITRLSNILALSADGRKYTVGMSISGEVAQALCENPNIGVSVSGNN